MEEKRTHYNNCNIEPLLEELSHVNGLISSLMVSDNITITPCHPQFDELKQSLIDAILEKRKEVKKELLKVLTIENTLEI